MADFAVFLMRKRAAPDIAMLADNRVTGVKVYAIHNLKTMKTKKIRIWKILNIAIMLIFCLSFVSADGDIIVLNFNYNKDPVEPLTLKGMTMSYGNITAKNFSIGNEYGILVSKNQTRLYTFKFKAPVDLAAENNKDFNISIPHLKQADKIQIIDIKRKGLIQEILLKSPQTSESKPTIVSVPPLSDSELTALASGNEGTPLQNKGKIDFAAYPNILYILGPLLFVLLLLGYIELKRKKDHLGLLSWQRNNKAAALKSYVSNNLKKGFSKEKIRNALIKSNYNSKEIEEAFRGMK